MLFWCHHLCQRERERDCDDVYYDLCQWGVRSGQVQNEKYLWCFICLFHCFMIKDDYSINTVVDRIFFSDLQSILSFKIFFIFILFFLLWFFLPSSFLSLFLFQLFLSLHLLSLTYSFFLPSCIPYHFFFLAPLLIVHSLLYSLPLCSFFISPLSPLSLTLSLFLSSFLLSIFPFILSHILFISFFFSLSFFSVSCRLSFSLFPFAYILLSFSILFY